MRPIPSSKREPQYFILACDHHVAAANPAPALRRYRFDDSDPSELVWPDEATVVQLRPLDDWEVSAAETEASLRARRTIRGEILYEQARTEALMASRGEETAAALEGRAQRHDIITVAWSRFEMGLSEEDNRFYQSYRQWRGLRAQEICRRAVVRILLSAQSQVTIRDWASSEVNAAVERGESHPLADDLPDSSWSDGYPVERVGRLISYWLDVAAKQHAQAGAGALHAAEAARITALRDAIASHADDDDAPSMESIEAEANLAASLSLIDLDSLDKPELLNIARWRGIKVNERLGVTRLRAAIKSGAAAANRYPELCAAILAIKDASEAAIWHGAKRAGDVWEELAEHAERLAILGKAGSSCSTPRG